MVQPTDTEIARKLRLAEIRRQIEAGVYETPDKLETAIDGLWNDLQSDNKASISPTDRPARPK